MRQLAVDRRRRPTGRVLVLVPAFNEEACVGQVVREIKEAGYPVLVIDDGSADRTASNAQYAGATVIRLPVNLGVGGALRCGFRYALTHEFDTVVQCDADGQHDPAEIAVLLDAMRTHDADLVIGSRFATDDDHEYAVGSTRRFVMHRLAHMASRRTGATITDATSGFRAIGGRLLGAFAASYPAEYLGDTIEALAQAGRRGFTVVQVGVHMRPRAAGVSTSSSLTSIWYLVRVVAALWLQRFRPEGRRVVRVTLWEGSPT
jgi:glycosyltransferase involved in cell wall biosynthesis